MEPAGSRKKRKEPFSVEGVDPSNAGEPKRLHQSTTPEGGLPSSQLAGSMGSSPRIVQLSEGNTNDTQLFDEYDGPEDYDLDENVGDDVEYYTKDENVGADCVEGRIEPEMVDEFLNGEERRQFRSKVWSEFTKIRVGGIVTKGKCMHCNCEITAKRGAGTSAMGTHLKRCTARKTVMSAVNQIKATVMSPQELGYSLTDRTESNWDTE